MIPVTALVRLPTKAAISGPDKSLQPTVQIVLDVEQADDSRHRVVRFFRRHL
jgi:hypothetical protein